MVYKVLHNGEWVPVAQYYKGDPQQIYIEDGILYTRSGNNIQDCGKISLNWYEK